MQIALGIILFHRTHLIIPFMADHLTSCYSFYYDGVCLFLGKNLMFLEQNDFLINVTFYI
jgi:hypothetical protein